MSAAAGFTAGSIAITGIASSSRIAETAAAVMVLHATTIAFAPCATSHSASCSERARIHSAGRSPYGACSESAR